MGLDASEVTRLRCVIDAFHTFECPETVHGRVGPPHRKVHFCHAAPIASSTEEASIHWAVSQVPGPLHAWCCYYCMQGAVVGKAISRCDHWCQMSGV
jgi:hypothetical protein